MKYDLGIIGGLGPKASSLLYEMITEKTKAKCDQDHLNIAILSHAKVPDRTAYILNNSKENPYPYILNDCKILKQLGVDMISIPCNTSCYFHSQLEKEIGIKINNLVENTSKYVSDIGYKKVAILATKGTIKSKLYQKYLDKNMIEWVVVNNDLVMDIIYNYVKKGKDVPKDLFYKIIDGANVDAFILGCTELSVVKRKLNLDDTFIDPLEIEVNNILKYFNKD